MFNFYTPFYASIKKHFRYYFRKRFKLRYPYLVKYEDQIVILSVFLFISSSLMFKTKRNKYFDFEWQSYFEIYKTEIMEILSLCSIRYLLDSDFYMNNKQQIEEDMPKLKRNFIEQYQDNFLEKYKNKREIDSSVDINKYPSLLNLVLRIHQLYQYQIPKESSKVLELVDSLTQWKEIAFDLFRYKSEYILYSFLVNLSR